MGKALLTAFKCLGMTALMIAKGYVFKIPDMSYTGGGLQMGMQDGFVFPTSLGNFMSGNFAAVRRIQFFVAIVIGSIPFDKHLGGARGGVGVSGNIGCDTSGSCSVGISVATTLSAVAKWDPAVDPGACLVGTYLMGPTGFTCMASVGVALTIFCCTYNFMTGASNCR